MDDDYHQSALFESPSLPYGLIYRPGFLARDEEASLLAAVTPLPFREARFREYFAKRRVVHFHAAEHTASEPSARDDDASSGELPPFLLALRQRVADWLEVDPQAFVHALVSEYRAGTPIGWHRDKPVYGTVVGVSLGSAGTMRFRPLPGSNRLAAKHAVALELQPRSAYVMQGPIRWQWQHSMLPTKELRYSITLRTQADAHSESQSHPQTGAKL